MASRSEKQRRADELAAEEEQAKTGGAVPPSEHVVDPANTGPGTAHPEADPVAGHDPDTAVASRKARDRAEKDRK
jgi:hypothetical protein